MDRAAKVKEVDFLGGCIKGAQLAICADFRGLTVAEFTSLRKSVRKSGAVGKVVKNTLARISSRQVLKESNGGDLDKFVGLFRGPTFLVYSKVDPVAPAKALQDFIKEKKKLTVKGAWVDGVFVDQAGVESLAKMPGKSEVLATLLALLMAPATQLARVIAAPGTQLARVIEAQRKKLEGSSEG